MERGGLPLVKGTLDLLAEWTSYGPLALSSRDSLPSPISSTCSFFLSLSLWRRDSSPASAKLRPGQLRRACLPFGRQIASLYRLDEVSKYHKNGLVLSGSS